MVVRDVTNMWQTLSRRSKPGLLRSRLVSRSVLVSRMASDAQLSYQTKHHAHDASAQSRGGQCVTPTSTHVRYRTRTV
jgi:hypothetical protein